MSMQRPTLLQFLANKRDYPRSEYVRQPYFESLYVRDSPIRFGGAIWTKALTIANVTVKKQYRGKGVLTSLIRAYHLEGYAIMVECVLEPRLCDGLIGRGFTCLNPNVPNPSYVLLPTDNFRDPRDAAD